MSYNAQSIKQIFNKRTAKNNNEFNSSRNNTDILTNQTITNSKKDIFSNLTIKRRINTIKKIRTKENYNNNKIINNSMDYKINEINKNNLRDINQNFISYFKYPNNKNSNNEIIQIDKYNSNYRTITESEHSNSKKILNIIYLKKNNSNENKKENFKYINSNLINKIKDHLKLKPKNELKNYANVIKNIKGSHIDNAILQCITNVEQLIKYFLSNEEEIKENKIQQPFSNAFLEMIENIWKNKFIKEYTSINCINIIMNQNNKFFYDSKDLIEFILDNLHKELNNDKDIVPSFKNLSNDNLDKYFQNFEKYYNKNIKSIITDLFYIKYDSQITCFECNNISQFINLDNVLEFSLEEVKKYMNINKKNITINDCLKYYQRQDFEYDKKCYKCNQEQIMGNIKILLKGPKVLIISINEKNNKENNLIIKDVINLNDCFYYKKNQYNYELISVITYLENDNFITFCKSFVDKNWYKYFDSKVVPSSFKETNSNGTPYLLFYSLIENKN